MVWVVEWRYKGVLNRVGFITRERARDAIRGLRAALAKEPSRSFPNFSKLRLLRTSTWPEEVESELTLVNGEWFASFGGYLLAKYHDYQDFMEKL